jgi:hypothetical protein
VQEGRIVIKAIGTEDMLADLLTKVVNEETLFVWLPSVSDIPARIPGGFRILALLHT